MNITVLVILVAFCLCDSNGASDGRLQRKQQRPTRGFKNVEMMTARGFGKRARTERDVEHQTPPEQERTNRGTPTFKSPSVGIARDFGKRTAELDFEDEPVHRKFSPKGPLMVAYEFGKRSNGDLDEEEEEIRVTRGTFKPNSNVLIARGYGKREDNVNGDEEIRVSRGGFKPKSNDGGYLFARGYGKRQDTTNEVYGLDNFWENLESQEKEAQDGADEKTLESIPLDWFVNEIINNPEFARSVVRKFIDLNQDGLLSSDELLRNV